MKFSSAPESLLEKRQFLRHKEIARTAFSTLLLSISKFPYLQ